MGLFHLETTCSAAVFLFSDSKEYSQANILLGSELTQG